MTRIKYDATILNYITLFESLTGAKVKDCISDEGLLFIIEKGNMGLAIGKGGSNLRRVENTFKKQVKVIEFDDNVIGFIKNYVFPLRKIQISQEGKAVKITGQDTKTKGLLIGRERANLKKLNDIVKRFFDIEDIMVI